MSTIRNEAAPPNDKMKGQWYKSTGMGTWRTFTLYLVSMVLLIAVATSIARAQTPTQPNFDAIDHYILDEMNTTRLPGLALAIVHGDQIVHIKGFGRADSSGGDVTPQTPFLIGSVTKSFTALAIMQLVEAHKLDLDAPVQRYLPGFQVGNDPVASQAITVRHLLHMTSGIPTMDGTTQSMRDDTSDDALERAMRALHTLPLTAPVGEQFQYANANYNTLGLLVQTVSGQSYEAYVHDHIFTPLEMHNSYTSPIEARAHGRATGHRYWFGWPVAYEMPFPRGTLPSGFLTISVEDMAHYLIAQLRGGQYKDVSLLSPAGMALLHEPAVPIGQEDHFYAMGWFVGSTNGVKTVSHGGDLANFHADIVLVPDLQWGVALLMNGNNGLDPSPLANITVGVTQRLMGHPILPPVHESSSRASFLVFTWIVIALQLLEMLRTTTLLRRWQHDHASRPVGLLRRGWHILPPLVLNLAWAALLLVIFTMIPFVVGGDLLTLMIHVPDLGYSIAFSLVLALTWPLLRTLLVVRTLRSTTPRIDKSGTKPLVEAKA